jgi:hypothetical protein
MPIPLGILAVAGAGGAPLTDDYELIQTVEGQNTTTVEFTSIPQTYKHLQIRHSIRSGQSGTAIQFRMRFNGVTTGTSYSSHSLFGNGSSVSWDVNTSSNYMNVGWATGSSGGTGHGAGVIDILDYALTNKNKTVRSLGGATTGSGSQVGMISALSMSTSAITSISFATITNGELLFANGAGTCKISLYGIR